MFDDKNIRGSDPPVSYKMSADLTFLALLALFLGVLAEDETFPYIPVKEVNISLESKSSQYPETLLLLPVDFPVDQKERLFEQLGIRLDPDMTPYMENELGEDEDADKEMEAVIYAAALVVNVTSPNTSYPLPSENSSTPQIYLLAPTVEEQFIRKRRSIERLAPVARVKRTLKKHKKGCMICQLLQPKQPIVINIIKPGDDCGGGCYQPQQPPCGHPHCGGYYQPAPQPVYHPPPQQTCHSCQQYHPPPPPPPVNQCDRCSHQPYHQPQHQPAYPQGGSYSQSSSSSSSHSSATSYNWQKK